MTNLISPCGPQEISNLGPFTLNVGPPLLAYGMAQWAGHACHTEKQPRGERP